MAKSNLVQLFRDYDKARDAAKEAETLKNELSTEIKFKLDDTEEVDTPEYLVTYKYDKDKEVVSFDEEKLSTKDPAAYIRYQKLLQDIENLTKKYTKTKTVKGARKLIVIRKEE